MSKYGSFEIKGIKDLEKAITEKYSSTKARRIIKDAVNSGADMVANKVEHNYKKTKGPYRKGYTAAGVMRSDARTKNDIVAAKVGWNGSKDRWRLVHLEEWGYVRSGKQYKSTAYGLLDKTLQEVKAPYLLLVKAGLMKYL